MAKLRSSRFVICRSVVAALVISGAASFSVAVPTSERYSFLTLPAGPSEAADVNTNDAMALAALLDCTWSEQAHPVASDAHPSAVFGFSMAISGDTAIVGAPDEPSGTRPGAAYVFTRNGSVWMQQQKLTASDAAAQDQFGISVSISGDTVIVGSYQDDNTRGMNAGSAYVFTRNGTVWTQQQKLTAADGADDDNFGDSVSISGDTAIVGAYFDDTAAGFNVGSAYVFTRGGTVWTQQQKLTASDGAEIDIFGTSVAIVGDTAIAGARNANTAGGPAAGAAYVFLRSGSVWTQQQKLTASDGQPSASLGISVALGTDTAIVGAYADDTPAGLNAGSAYIFSRKGAVWTEQQKLTASDGSRNAAFGLSVGISGDTAIVGEYQDDMLGTDAGAAYIFSRSGTAWTERQKLTASDGAAFDYFGNAVAIAGDTAIVGSEFDATSGGLSTGSAYVYKQNCSSISGTITYGNAIGSPNPRFVSNVLMTGNGSVPVSTSTDLSGAYALAGFGAGGYTVSPTKSGEINGGISSFDAGRVAQHAAGTFLLNGNQLIVADVSGNGTISSFDAGQIARFVAGVPGSGATGNWVFNPPNRAYTSINGSITGEDYSALLMGEVSGNWTSTGARPQKP